jgi:hypothetical protein
VAATRDRIRGTASGQAGAFVERIVNVSPGSSGSERDYGKRDADGVNFDRFIAGASSSTPRGVPHRDNLVVGFDVRAGAAGHEEALPVRMNGEWGARAREWSVEETCDRRETIAAWYRRPPTYRPARAAESSPVVFTGE